MGGNVFKNKDGTSATTHIMKEDVLATVKWLESVTGLDFTSEVDSVTGYPVKWLGSTGKKEMSGDLDLAVDANLVTKQELVEKLLKWVNDNKLDQRDFIAKKSELHFKTPINGDVEQGFVQTDFIFFDDFEWGTFYYAGGEKSNYKGAVRNILLSSIAKPLGLKVGSRGVISRMTENVITTDPDYACEILLGSEFTRHDLRTVENIYRALKNDDLFEDRMHNFREFLVREKLTEPQV